MKILIYDIPTELQDNSFILSLSKQALKNESLSANQHTALQDMLGIEDEDLVSNVNNELDNLQTIKRYYEYFYRTDYHGDYLSDHSYAFDVDEEELDKKIQDLNSAQYGVESYTNKYKFINTLSIPKSVTNISKFMSLYYEDYLALTAKLTRNRFKTVKGKNTTLRAVKSLLEQYPNDTLISNALGKQYRYNRRG